MIVALQQTFATDFATNNTTIRKNKKFLQQKMQQKKNNSIRKEQLTKFLYSTHKAMLL